MYKVLKVDGSTIYLGGANKEIITVDKDSFNYENPKVGDYCCKNRFCTGAEPNA